MPLISTLCIDHVNKVRFSVQLSDLLSPEVTCLIAIARLVFLPWEQARVKELHGYWVCLWLAAVTVLYWVTVTGVSPAHICSVEFSLVILSLFSQVRAGSLQELVYKSGQAGVTKATVTITFDNKDKKQSPVGYESYDELTVSRQVSYLVECHVYSMVQSCPNLWPDPLCCMPLD